MNKGFSLRYLFKNNNQCIGHNTFSIRSINTEKIEIPHRIKRGPTDILRAIANTVAVDKSGPAYKYYDDPFLSPMSHVDKRRYGLAKEAGRKAAQWIRDNNPELFSYRADEPIIKAFLPKITYENEEINEVAIQEAIKNVQVADALNMYNVCLSKNLKLSHETLQSLLELLCYFNCEPTVGSDWIEERLNHPARSTSKIIRTWKDQGIAEQIFNSIKEDGSKPYCAIIRGMSQYYQSDQATQHFQEALEKDLVLDTNTYNAILRLAPLHGDDTDTNWTFIQDTLMKMVENKVKPNLGTLNAVLQSFNTFYRWGRLHTLTLQTLKEFELLGIEPSPASYYYIIKIFNKDKSSTSPVLLSILDRLEGKSLTLRDEHDTWFFLFAMESAHNIKIADRVHRLLMVENNINLLGENLKVNAYYRSYFLQAMDGLTFEEFWIFYDQFVPFIYPPDHIVYDRLLKVCGSNDNVDEIPRIWSDMIMLTHASNLSLVELTLMVMNNHNLEALNEDKAAKLSIVASDTYDRMMKFTMGKRYDEKKSEWSGITLGDCMTVLARLGDTSKALSILKTANDNPKMFLSDVTPDHLRIVFNILIQQKDEACYEIVQYANFCNYQQVEDMISEMEKSLDLSDEMKNSLTKLHLSHKPKTESYTNPNQDKDTTAPTSTNDAVA